MSAAVRAAAPLAAALLLLLPLAPGPRALSAQETTGLSQDALEAAGDSAYEAGDRERARELYRRVLERDPDDQRVLLRLGLLAGWQDDYMESLEYLDRLLELNPGRSDAVMARARVLAWSGRRGAAIEALRDALRDRPGHVATRRTLARILTWEDRHEEAARALVPAVRLEPDDPELREELARAYERAERWEEAEAQYRALADAPGAEAARVRLRIADLRRVRGDRSGAREDYLMLVPDLPVEARLALGRMAREDGDYVGAEERFRAAVAADPEDIEARVMLARVLRWQGRNRTALEVLRRARALDPGAGAADWRWARSMVAPRTRVSYGAGHDSDGNDMASLDGSFSFPLGPRLEVSGGVTWQDNFQETETFSIAREAVIGELGLGWKSDLGWSASMEAGRMSFPDAGLDDATNLGASVGTPSRNRLAVDASFHSQVLDYTAVLIREQVRSVGGDLSARLRLGGGWSLSGGAALAEFRGEEGDNRRTGGDVVLSFPRWGQISVELEARSYAFERDLNDGYYDPDLYAKGELVARWDENLVDPVEIGLEVSPGYRYSRNAPGLEGSWKPTIGGEADLALVFTPGRRLQFRGSYSKSDPATLGAGVGEDEGYEYWSLRAGLAWAF